MPGYVFLPSKPYALESQLGTEHLGVVPASWNEDFQLGINYACVFISGGLPVSIGVLEQERGTDWENEG